MIPSAKIQSLIRLKSYSIKYFSIIILCIFICYALVYFAGYTRKYEKENKLKFYFRVLLYKIKNGLKKRVRQVLEVYDLDFEIKDKYDIDDLLEVTRILRSENGCPWDREQDHKWSG